MDVHVLGSGTCVPQADRSSPACLVSLAEDNVLVDGGTGTMRRLLEAGFHYSEVDYLFYTHTHPDHVLDLVPFLFATKHTPGMVRTKPLHVLGPSGFRDFFDRLMGVFGEWVLSDDYPLELDEMEDESERVFGSWKVTTRALNHPVPTVGYRFSESGSVAVVSGDTDYCEEIVDLAKNADLLLLECSFPDQLKVGGHLTPQFASQIARESGCKRLLTMHMYPMASPEQLAEACREGFDGEVIAGRDLLKVSV
jgi:ribonuclease BN (tRNA processing enzyme)